MKVKKVNTKKTKPNGLEKTSKIIKKSNVEENKTQPSKIPLKPKVVQNIEKKKVKNDKSSIQTTKKVIKTKTWTKSGPVSNEKTDWNQYKVEKRNLKIKRKEGKYKDLFSLIKESKIIYEKLKCRRIEKKEKDMLSEKLFNMLSKDDGIHKFVMAHDTSRVIQCLLKHSSPKIREQLSLALIPISITMMQSRHSHFCIIRMIKYGSNTTKNKLIESLYGSVVKLCSHNISGKIMDIIYFSNASKTHKIYLRQEFYSDFLAKSKDLNIEHLKDAYNVIPNSKEFVLQSLKKKLTHLVNKTAMDNSLVHEILFEYITESNHGKEKEECDEFLKLCIPQIPQLVTTKTGTKCANHIFWVSQTRERRAIVNTIKAHLTKICNHEHGHQLILAIVNSLDDTKAIKKSIFDLLIENFQDIMANQYGRRVLLWFISPADKEIFHPDLITYLEEGLIHSKKDKTLRRKEIFEQIEDTLCEKIKENPQLWLSTSCIGLVTAAFIKQISPNKSNEIFQPLIKEIISPTWKIENTDIEGIEDNGMHHVLKKIFKCDSIKLQKEEPTFSEQLLKNISAETIEFWIPKNRGCFVLILLFESLHKEKQKDLRSVLEPYMTKLKELSHMGSQILIKKIKNVE